MSEINPYTIRFITGPSIWFSPRDSARKQLHPKTQWVTFIEAYTAEDALTQFKAGSKTYLRDARFGAFLGHVYIESIEPGLPRCPKCGAAMEHRTGLPRESLRCIGCDTHAMFPWNLGEVSP